MWRWQLSGSGGRCGGGRCGVGERQSRRRPVMTACRGVPEQAAGGHGGRWTGADTWSNLSERVRACMLIDRV
jgi:hypothetical protein